MGILYKLSRCRVWRTMLRWLQAYLKNRPFKVFIKSSNKRINPLPITVGGQQLEFTKQFKGATINFKLPPQIYIVEHDLIAINEALQWMLLNNCPEEKYVIFSDSLSSLHLIQNTRPKNYLPIVFNIQDKLFNIASSYGIYLQFILGCKGIRGNEAAKKCLFASVLHPNAIL
ncbi:Ribonuclease H-like domain [Trinorchestia longiramus]|nr:Ribonuclease H-like domain [Trinorchestia longiramus]